MDILTNLSLFSGAGGLDLGARLVGGFRTVCYVEYDRYAQGVLMSRFRDGGLDEASIWDDVRTFDGKAWRGVDIISGGFPCQDVSVAGKRAGIKEGARSGLWHEFARIIREVGPLFVLVENVPGLLAHPGLGVVLGDLAEMGYDAEWFVLSAAAVGAPHLRERVWIVAYRQGFAPCADADFVRSHRTKIDQYRGEQWGAELPNKQERELGSVGEDVAHSDSARRKTGRRAESQGGASLPERVRYPTPRAQDGMKMGTGSLGDKKLWATPQARDHFPAHKKDYIDKKKAEGHGMSNLNDQVGGQLNPTWVEWLMGWPLGWTVLDALATAWSLSNRLRRGKK